MDILAISFIEKPVSGGRKVVRRRFRRDAALLALILARSVS